MPRSLNPADFHDSQSGDRVRSKDSPFSSPSDPRTFCTRTGYHRAPPLPRPHGTVHRVLYRRDTRNRKYASRRYELQNARPSGNSSIGNSGPDSDRRGLSDGYTQTGCTDGRGLCESFSHCDDRGLGPPTRTPLYVRPWPSVPWCVRP